MEMFQIVLGDQERLRDTRKEIFGIQLPGPCCDESFTLGVIEGWSPHLCFPVMIFKGPLPMSGEEISVTILLKTIYTRFWGGEQCSMRMGEH